MRKRKRLGTVAALVLILGSVASKFANAAGNYEDRASEPVSRNEPVRIAAAPSKSFYEGKTVTIVVGTPPGGGYDLYARLLMRHMGKHIPGKPQVIVENMSGAGGLTAANHVYNRAKPD